VEAGDGDRGGFKLPERLEQEWGIWRVCTHEYMKQSYHEVCELWTIDDLLDANQVLDAIENAQAWARADAEREAKRGVHGRGAR
jgi:hypothetical protein